LKIEIGNLKSDHGHAQMSSLDAGFRSAEFRLGGFPGATILSEATLNTVPFDFNVACASEQI